MALIGIKVRRQAFSEPALRRLHDALAPAPLIEVFEMGDIEPIYDDSEILMRIEKHLEAIASTLSVNDSDTGIPVLRVKTL